MAQVETKSVRIDIRTTRVTKDLLQRAAAATHKNVSEFLLDVGLAAATETLADQRVFVLDDERWDEFIAALDRPVQLKPRLVKLLSEPSILE